MVPTQPSLSPTDRTLLRQLRRGPQRAEELARHLGVTASAVRARLARLVACNLVRRQPLRRQGPGRPGFCYQLTVQGERALGSAMPELTAALWQELRRSSPLRRGMLQRLAQTTAQLLAAEVHGHSTQERLHSLVQLLQARNIRAQVHAHPETDLPVLTMHDCPYAALAQQDRSICAMERMALAQVVQAPLRLAQCRFHQGEVCQFQAGS